MRQPIAESRPGSMLSGPRTKYWSARARCRNRERHPGNERCRVEPSRDALGGSLRGENLAEPLDRAQHLFLRQPRPLAAHDEVIDAEKLAITRDLLLHRDFVADDEPVAREFGERHRGAVLEPPCRVGVVLVF